MLAVIRGLRGERELGDFYLDMMRGLCFVLVPLSTLLAILLVATGVPMTLRGAAPGEHARAGHADDRGRAGGRGGGDQAARHQRRRLSSGRIRRIRSRTRAPGATSSR